jgi:hypothetical protein
MNLAIKEPPVSYRKAEPNEEAVIVLQRLTEEIWENPVVLNLKHGKFCSSEYNVIDDPVLRPCPSQALRRSRRKRDTQPGCLPVPA